MYNWVGILVHILMYILFINSSDRCNNFFFTQFNNNSNKKNYQTHGFNPTQPDTYGLGWTHMDWVGLNLCDELCWIEFFLTHHNELSKNISLTWSMHTPNKGDKVEPLSSEPNPEPRDSWCPSLMDLRRNPWARTWPKRCFCPKPHVCANSNEENVNALDSFSSTNEV